jgi:hypothetical protein
VFREAERIEMRGSHFDQAQCTARPPGFNNNRRARYFPEMTTIDTAKIVLAALLLLQCRCLMYEHFHDKAMDIKDDSHELSLPGPYDPGVDHKTLTGAFAGIVQYKNDTYFDVLVDSLLKNRYFSYLHILIPAGKNNEPRMIDSNDCSIYDLYKGKCGDNGVLLLEDSIKPFTWNGMPRNIYFQFRGYIYDAICFKYINTANDTVFYKSFIKDREIKWVERKKSKYRWNKTLSYAVLPVDVVLFPFVTLVFLGFLVQYKATHS